MRSVILTPAPISAPGYQHLDARQALAFVRQRHGLPNGDLDRTHRQQAFLDSVMHQLRAEGVLSDLTKMRALLSVAKQYVITDAGWNLLDFSTQMRSLTSGNLVFRTLPIQGYATIDGQDANAVNPASIKAIVHAAFSPQPAPRGGQSRSGGTATPVTVDVLNGGSTAGLAGRDSAALTRAGYRAGKWATPATGPLRRSGTGRESQRARPGSPAVRRYRHGQLIGSGRAC